MDNEYYLALARVRMERAKELLIEAKELLDKEAYKSANNRAFYAIEKSVKHCWLPNRWKLRLIMVV